MAKVTERDSLIARFLVENRRERAYLAKLFIEYNNVRRNPFFIKKKILAIEERVGRASACAEGDIERNTKNGH